MNKKSLINVAIDQGVELPQTRYGGSGNTRAPLYPWGKMRHGDSFEIPRGTFKSTSLAQTSAYSSCKTFSSHHDGEFRAVTRTVPETGHVRVWMRVNGGLINGR